MRLFLTSGGITNPTLARALQELVGKPYEEMKIAFIPTAAFADRGDKGWLIDDLHRINDLGASVDIADIAQLRWGDIYSRLEFADVIFVGGGNTYYLSYWMKESGLFEKLPELLKTRVYAGISAGSMIVGDNLKTSSTALARGVLKDEEYDELGPHGRSAAITAHLVPFVVRPHMNSRYFPMIREKALLEVTKTMTVPVYAIDDQTAIRIIDDEIVVVSEGEWKIYDNNK